MKYPETLYIDAYQPQTLAHGREMQAKNLDLSTDMQTSAREGLQPASRLVVGFEWWRRLGGLSGVESSPGTV